MPKALIELREKTIKAINESSDKQAFIYKNAELLFNNVFKKLLFKLALF